MSAPADLKRVRGQKATKEKDWPVCSIPSYLPAKRTLLSGQRCASRVSVPNSTPRLIATPTQRKNLQRVFYKNQDGSRGVIVLFCNIAWCSHILHPCREEQAPVPRSAKSRIPPSGRASTQPNPIQSKTENKNQVVDVGCQPKVSSCCVVQVLIFSTTRNTRQASEELRSQGGETHRDSCIMLNSLVQPPYVLEMHLLSQLPLVHLCLLVTGPGACIFT